ncbi:hypothetical protein HHK36_023695 [Tetracentron sinense]|uniref:Uncharacterized protein n=1 Tax=Tetracentron sinense TaxID=13715 RepID=A0A834YQP8_TETSI|nr:hypothetical protein HHK36_023695 [Tetracentron sinense]
MELPHTVQAHVQKIKEEIFSPLDPCNFVSPSAYDTAWLAMIPDPRRLERPFFEGCLDWVLNNQNELGFWGESHVREVPTIDSLPATLACMVALKVWNVGTKNIEKGLEFIHANAEKLLTEQCDGCPRWFAIAFPAMVELALAAGLQIAFPDSLKGVVEDIFIKRKRILEMEELVDHYHYPPLISYLEALPPSYNIHEEDILQHLSEDGSLFQSPSATARAFMATGNKGCMIYLESLVQRCGSRVPSTYPVDEELIKLCLVNQIQRLGLAEHFIEEIEDILAHVYGNYMIQESRAMGNIVQTQIYKDSLAFRLLRMQGYCVSPWIFCWFLRHEDILVHIEKNHEYFLSAMFSVYRATDLMFSEENELQEARSFSRKLLETAISSRSTKENLLRSPNFLRVIEHELRLPWLARLDHLEHRMWIEENETNALLTEKVLSYRLSFLHNDALLQLAVESFKFRQAIYKKELEELKRWTKDYGLSDMGFGREKTTYCYFAVATSSSLPYNSETRIIATKSAVLVTVTDDFFDMKGSLDELESLTDAIRIWEGKSLNGHSKVIFNALDNLISDVTRIYFVQQGHDITKDLRDIWYETFVSWMMEAKWSRSRYTPTIDEYLETGMNSISAHTIILPALCLMNPSLPNHMMRPGQYETVTKLLMVSTRLLNDIQSYQKELEDGKINLVLIYLKENPEADIEESIAFIRKILDQKKSELLEHILMDDMGNMPKPCKQLHLCCLKVFQMFFNSTNGFDSETEMLHDINKAIYLPLEVQRSHPLKALPSHNGSKKGRPMTTAQYNRTSKLHGRKSVAMYQIPRTSSGGGYGRRMFVLPKFVLRMI